MRKVPIKKDNEYWIEPQEEMKIRTYMMEDTANENISIALLITKKNNN